MARTTNEADLQRIKRITDGLCDRFQINNKNRIETLVKKAINGGARIDDIEVASYHIIQNSLDVRHPISYIHRVLQNQVRVVKFKSHVGISEWDFVSEEEKVHRFLTQRDIDILMAVFEHNFLDREMVATLFFRDATYKGSHLKNFQNTAKTALKRLYLAGCLMKHKIVMPGFGGPTIMKPTIYTLSKEGYLQLARRGLIKDFNPQWQPLPLQVAPKINIDHELSVNRFCIELKIEAGDHGREFDWWASNEAYQKISSPVPGQHGVVMEPDSALMIDNLLVLLEVERSGRRKDMLDRLTRWHKYERLNGWKEKYGQTRPYLLFVVPTVNIIEHGINLDRIVSLVRMEKSSHVAVMNDGCDENGQRVVHLINGDYYKKLPFWEWASDPFPRDMLGV